MTSDESRTWWDVAPAVGAVGSLFTAGISLIALQNSLYETKAARAEAAAQRAHAEKALEATQAAMLAFDRATNIMKIQRAADGWEIARGPDGIAIPQHPLFATVRNFGAGVALNCSAQFVILEIDGEPHPKEENSPIKCSPMNILPNGESHVYALPTCVANDKANRIRCAKGYVSFTCHTASGKRETSSQKVEIRPDYDNATVTFVFEGPEFIDNWTWL